MQFKLTIAICLSLNPHECNQKHKTSSVWLTLWRPAAFRNFWQKNNETHVYLRMNISGPVALPTQSNAQKMRQVL